MVNLIPDIEQSCLRCGKKALITDTETGEIFCGGCGYVSSERVESTGPERRSFPDDRMNRERTDFQSISALQHGILPCFFL